MTQPLYLRAEARFATEPGEDRLPKRLSGVAYSGDRVPDRNLVIDLSSTNIDIPAPLLAQHSGASTVGRVVAAEVGDQLAIEADLYSDIDDEARLIAKKAKRGHPWQLSVGLFGFTVEWVDIGKTVTVNGRQFAGPLEVLRQGTIREVSIVAVGADPGTSTSFMTNQRNHNAMADNATDQVARFAAVTAERDTARARVVELEAAAATSATTIATLTAERDAAVAKVAELEKAARDAAVRAMFSAAGWEFTEEAARPYLLMQAEAFEAVSKDIRERVRPASLPAHLTQNMTPSGAAAPGGASTLLSVVKSAHGVK